MCGSAVLSAANALYARHSASCDEQNMHEAAVKPRKVPRAPAARNALEEFAAVTFTRSGGVAAALGSLISKKRSFHTQPITTQTIESSIMYTSVRVRVWETYRPDTGQRTTRETYTTCNSPGGAVTHPHHANLQ